MCLLLLVSLWFQAERTLSHTYMLVLCQYYTRADLLTFALCLPKLVKEHVKVASFPSGTVTFCIFPINSGPPANTETPVKIYVCNKNVNILIAIALFEETILVLLKVECIDRSRYRKMDCCMSRINCYNYYYALDILLIVLLMNNC